MNTLQYLLKYDEQEAESLATIMEYLKMQAPGNRISLADAIRFAIVTKAADIRMETIKYETPAGS